MISEYTISYSSDHRTNHTNMLTLVVWLVLALSLASNADVQSSDNATCELADRCEPLELDRLSGSHSDKSLWQLATLQKTVNRTSNVTTTIIGTKKTAASSSDLEVEATALDTSMDGEKGDGHHNDTLEHGKNMITIMIYSKNYKTKLYVT